jgi:hypothetical protein
MRTSIPAARGAPRSAPRAPPWSHPSLGRTSPPSSTEKATVALSAIKIGTVWTSPAIKTSLFLVQKLRAKFSARPSGARWGVFSATHGAQSLRPYGRIDLPLITVVSLPSQRMVHSKTLTTRLIRDSRSRTTRPFMPQPICSVSACRRTLRYWIDALVRRSCDAAKLVTCQRFVRNCTLS